MCKKEYSKSELCNVYGFVSTSTNTHMTIRLIRIILYVSKFIHYHYKKMESILNPGQIFINNYNNQTFEKIRASYCNF